MNTAINSVIGNALDLPFELRANDVVRHIINIDSRFRELPASTTSDFYYRLFAPVKNILRIRVTSVEFPNNYLMFTEARENISLRIIYDLSAVKTYGVVIPDGNYSAYEMQVAIQNALTDLSGLTLTVAFDHISGSFTFTGNQYFAVDTTWHSLKRPFDYGLGYYLGFSRKCHKAFDVSGSWIVTSNQCASFSGDNYVFLKINEFNCVQQQTADQTFQCLAKVLLREPKNYMAFDDYASQHVKEVVFPQPQDLSRFHIQILDAYGNMMDLCNAQLSFSLEVLEVRNLSLYNAIRDSITLQYV